MQGITKLYLCECGEKATWSYVLEEKSSYFCDECVPRGDPHNYRYIDKNEPTEMDIPFIWIEQDKIWTHVDSQGRQFPYMDYRYNKNGFKKTEMQSDYLDHIFYTTEHLSFCEKNTILNDAIDTSYLWWVDILDCNVSFSREKINMSIEQIMSKFNDRCHFVIIYRRGYEKPFHGEIGFSTLDNNKNTYFLFIYLNEEKFYELIKKYKLIERKY
ncbi:hypothetical protein M0P65_07655 [Candidatus Gracilibacteria bacterium]|jgi:hypothetical protein|nr:hypothetical protein [Candidatus Gracilibacteria bacterium]